MQSIRIAAALTCLALLAVSCVTVEPVREQAQLRQTDSSATLSLLTKDGSIYHLNRYEAAGNAVRGSGTREFAGRTLEFSGSLTFDDIEYAQVETDNSEGTIAAAAVAAVISGAVAADMLAETKTEVRPYPKEGESCPYVYSWNGREYVLEAEAFGTSLGSALQRETRHVLPSLRAQDGKVRFRIRNERPETHYIDRVGLRRVLHAPGTRVVLDAHGKPWQVGALTAPLRSDISAADSRRCVFARPEGAIRGLLVVTAKNREMTGGIFQETFAWLGTDALRFVRDLEQDAGTVRLLREWLRRCALEVQAGAAPGQLAPAGVIDPEGTEVAFTRAVPLEFPAAGGADVAVQLSALPGLWDILDVRIAWEFADGLRSEELPVVSCVTDGGSDARSLLAAADGSYCTLLPPEAVDVVCAAGADEGSGVWTYVVEATGYLHLWYRPHASSGLFAAFDDIPPAERRHFVRDMMGRPALVLPLLAALAQE
jgi:hypothetical protein